MSFFARPETESVKLKLVRDRTRVIKQGFPWIYRDWLAEAPPAPAGTRAMLKDKDGSLLAFGMYDPESPLTMRVCALEKERLNDELIERRLRQAVTLRGQLFDDQTTGYRLINGEGDLLPGLVCDRYESHAVIRFDGEGPAAFWNKPALADWLESCADLPIVFEKFRTEKSTRGTALRGEAPKAPVRFLEHGLTFAADIVQGQKTGFFFDQRENRQRIRLLAQDRRMLNLCGYTGGFSIYAGMGGAREVTTLDLAKPAIESSKENWRLNHLPEAGHHAVVGDVFEFLAEAKQSKRTWDLVVVDPPSFASAERHLEKAKLGYLTMFTNALHVLDQGGIIAFSSCSSHITMPLFIELCQEALSKARRRGVVLGAHGQPEDHPFPLACIELQYLKFVTVRVG